jgi:hypothetical protein
MSVLPPISAQEGSLYLVELQRLLLREVVEALGPR